MKTEQSQISQEVQEIINTIRSNNTPKLKSGHDHLYSDSEFIAITEALKINDTLTEYGFRNNNISEHTVNTIFDSLGVNKGIKIFGFAVNHLSKDNISSLAKALEANKNLTSLCIEELSSERQESIKPIILAINTNGSIKKLGFNNFNFSREDIEAIGNLLEQSKLEELYLISCKISSDSSEIWGNLIKTNSTLKKIYFHNNRISDEGTIAIFRNLLHSENTNLTKFSCNGSRISGTALSDISNILKKIKVSNIFLCIIILYLMKV